MCKYSFYNGNRSGINTFLNGMGSLDIWGGRSAYDKYSSPGRADNESLKKDWVKVGNDFRNVINSFTKNNIPGPNGSR